MLTVVVVNLAANLSLVILMLKTEKRTLQNRRPQYDLLNNTPQQKRRTVDEQNQGARGPFIRVKFNRKLVNKTFFSLIIKTHDETLSSFKISKSYQDFEELQRVVKQVANKQNAFFQNAASFDNEQLTKAAFIVKAPTLENVKKSFLGS